MYRNKVIKKIVVGKRRDILSNCYFATLMSTSAKMGVEAQNKYKSKRKRKEKKNNRYTNKEVNIYRKHHVVAKLTVESNQPYNQIQNNQLRQTYIIRNNNQVQLMSVHMLIHLHR